MLGIYLLYVMRWSSGLFYCFIIHYFTFYCDIMHPARTLKKYRHETTSVRIKITKYSMRERQICIGKGLDTDLLPHAAHQHTYWKHSVVCLLCLCWFIVPSSGWSIAVVWIVLTGSLAHRGLFNIDSFSCWHLHLLLSASDNHNNMNQEQAPSQAPYCFNITWEIHFNKRHSPVWSRHWYFSLLNKS